MKKIIEIVIARIFLLLKKTIKLHPLVKVNLRTQFETHIKIYKYVDIRDSNIGCGTYINRGSVLRYAEIGRFCSIGPDVRIIYGKHPISEFISSHPAFFSTKKQAGFCFAEENLFSESSFKHSKSALLIENDVWIGEGVRFLEGITVGDGAVIGAGALVTKDIEPYSVYGGIPARKIKMRFSPEEVKKLQSLKWWNRDFKWIKKNYLLFDSIDLICKEAENDSE